LINATNKKRKNRMDIAASVDPNVNRMMDGSDPLRNIVVVGGGFAGTTFARRLQRRMPRGFRLMMISEESYTTFNPMLAEVVGASLFPEHVVAPLRQIVRQSETTWFMMGKVSGLDFENRMLRCATLSGDREVVFDQLILAFGCRARLDFIPGMAEHALPLKSIGDAMEIRNLVLRRLARIELEEDGELRRSLGHFVVIGGGFSGVELAGELIDVLHGILHFYPRVKREELRVTLIHDRERLLPELPAALGLAAEASLQRRGVTIRLETRASKVDAEGALLANGEFLIAQNVISTIGTRPNELVESSPLPMERGRIVVDADFSVPGFAGVWALGDCALAKNDYDGTVSPPTAQFAVRQGFHLARTLRRSLDGLSTKPFRYKSRGSMATVGRLNGVAQVFGLPISGLPAWLLWRAYYLSQMPTFGRKLRIFVEWTWGMFFPADITHFRFTRSKDL
jgi:NADH dehydrogenase